MRRAALPRRHAAADLRSVRDRLFGVKRALRTGEALGDDDRVGIDQDRHVSQPPARL